MSTRTGKVIAKERGIRMSNAERLEQLIKRRPGAVLTAMAQLPQADVQSLKWLTRRALTAMMPSACTIN